MSKSAEALQDYVDDRRDAEVKEQTIKRELAEVLACLRLASAKYRLKWDHREAGTECDEEAERSVCRERSKLCWSSTALNPERGRGTSCSDTLVGTTRRDASHRR